MDNSENVRAGSPEWFIMKKFAKTMVMLNSPKESVTTALMSEYDTPYKVALHVFIAASFDLGKVYR